MFEHWRLNRRLKAISRQAGIEHKKLTKSNASEDEFANFAHQYSDAVAEAERAFDVKVGLRLAQKARIFDIETPPKTDTEMWDYDQQSGSRWYSAKGRTYLRKLIDEEKSRRFEVKTLWVTKFWLPLLAALVGIIGALTGLFAVMHRKPDQPEKKAPTFERLADTAPQRKL
jgi:hypothetical protein